MKTHNPFAMLFVLNAFLVIFLATACSESTIRLGWSCVNGINKLDCDYRKFTGREIKGIRIEAGEKLTIDYDVKIVSGALVMKVHDPEGETIWKIEYLDSHKDIFTFPMVKVGLYSLIIEGRDTEGSYLVEWDIGN